MNARVLIVEDDKPTALALRVGLEHEGYTVVTAVDGAEGLRLASESKVDVIVLDVMLPKLSGIEVCRKLRNVGNMTPIIMLTARGQESDKVVGLKLGADDYVTKPFSLMELLARVEALLRRLSTKLETVEHYQFGKVKLDFKKLEATKDGVSIGLSAREFEILKYLIQHRGEVVTRDQLLDAVWGYDSFPMTRTVDMHMSKLRQKIEDDHTTSRYLITMHRIGYKFVG